MDFLNKEDLSILCSLRYAPVKTVYFYHDEKIYREENERFIQMMHQFGLAWKVKKLQHWQVEPLKWGQDSLFVIPGGHTTDIHERLSPKIEEIKQYAQQGGSLFFQCGGSYWAGKREYRFNAENIVNRDSELNLWKGRIIGPRIPNPKSLEKGEESYIPQTVEIFWENIEESGNLMLTGGGTFIADPREPYYPLARYSNGDLAAVSVDVGLGQAILSMPYVTYPACTTTLFIKHFKQRYPSINTFKMHKEIVNSEKFRVKCCLRLFKAICKL